jgi:hypothetical protein
LRADLPQLWTETTGQLNKTLNTRFRVRKVASFMPQVDAAFKAPASKSRAAKYTQKKAIEADAYYSLAELYQKSSPYYLASQATLWRWINDGKLEICMVGRRRFISGVAIHKLLRGGAASGD